MRLTLGTITLKRPIILPDAKPYRAVWGYVRRGPDCMVRVYSDPGGRQRVLSVHRDEVIGFRPDTELPYVSAFDAVNFKPIKPKREENLDDNEISPL